MKRYIFLIIFLFIGLIAKSQYRGLWFEASQYFQLGDSTVTVWGSDTLTNTAMVRQLISGYGGPSLWIENSDTSKNINSKAKTDSLFTNYVELRDGGTTLTETKVTTDTTTADFGIFNEIILDDQGDNFMRFVNSGAFFQSDDHLYITIPDQNLTIGADGEGDAYADRVTIQNQDGFNIRGTNGGQKNWYFGWGGINEVIYPNNSIWRSGLDSIATQAYARSVVKNSSGSSGDVQLSDGSDGFSQASDFIADWSFGYRNDYSGWFLGNPNTFDDYILFVPGDGGSFDIEHNHSTLASTGYALALTESSAKIKSQDVNAYGGYFEIRATDIRNNLTTATGNSILTQTAEGIRFTSALGTTSWGDENLITKGYADENYGIDSVLANSTDTIQFIRDTVFANGEEGSTSVVIKAGGLALGDSEVMDSLLDIGEVAELLKENTITVSPSGGTFTTIKEAFDSINIAGSDSANRWLVSVSPGVYTEDNTTPLKFPIYTALKSTSTVGGVVVKPSTAGDLFEMSNITSFSGFQIQDVTNGSAIEFSDTGSIAISDIIFSDCDTAITVNAPLSLTNILNIFLANADGFNYKGVNVLRGNVIAAEVLVAGIDTIRIPFYASGSNSILTVQNAISYSPNIDTFLVARDSSSVIITSTSIVNAKNGIASLSNAMVKYNGDSHSNITGSYTINDETSILAGYSNNDDNDEALIIEGQELHVGDAAQGFEVCLGQGDSYSDDIIVYEYNGSTYTDVSDSAKRIDGFNVEFPNTSVNTAIYMASDVADSMIHHGLKIALTDSMTIGAGEVLLEYWNGTAWTEFNGMVTDSDAPFAYHAKEYFEPNNGTHIRYDIDMTNNEDWVANDDPGRGVDKKYIRFRIASGITTSPKIDQIKLHPSRFEINTDGYPESFGNARNTQILQLNIGSGKPIEGNMQSQDIYVDENIGVGFLQNRFTAAGDILGFPINLPDNLDTSSPINLVWSGRATNSASITWTVRWRIVSPDQVIYTTEPAASGNAFSTTTTKTTVAGNNELFTVKLDVSTSIPSRKLGFGDQLWLSIEPSTLTGSFDITNIGAEYWTWSEGGHY